MLGPAILLIRVAFIQTCASLNRVHLGGRESTAQHELPGSGLESMGYRDGRTRFDDTRICSTSLQDRGADITNVGEPAWIRGRCSA
jgi:hypothetical protein